MKNRFRFDLRIIYSFSELRKHQTPGCQRARRPIRGTNVSVRCISSLSLYTIADMSVDAHPASANHTPSFYPLNLLFHPLYTLPVNFFRAPCL